jgi:hypothetical protein
MIESTVTTARHKPTPKRSKKEPPIPAIVKIVGEPSLSSKDEGWYYFWAEHQNSKRKDWSILCTEEQIDWVVEQMQDNVQLIEGTHFADKRMRTEDGYVTRSVLAEEFQTDEPAEEEQPMTWQEVPVVAQTPQNPVIDKASELFNNFLVTRKRFENSASIQGFDDLIFRSVVSASISCERTR